MIFLDAAVSVVAKLLVVTLFVLYPTEFGLDVLKEICSSSITPRRPFL